MAAEQRRREQQDKERARAQLIKVVESHGLNAEEVNRVLDRLEELQPVLQAKFEELQKSLVGTGEEVESQLKGACAAELTKVAVEVIGERGRQLAKVWPEPG